MNLISTISTLLVAIALTGCASTSKTMAPEAAAGIKRVAVVSVTADEFTRQYVGFTVFGNEFEKKSIASWSIDKAYEDQIGAAAEKVFGATVVKAAYPLADFARVNELKGPWDAPAYWGPNWALIEAPTRDLCAANKLDGVLVAARQKEGDTFGGTNQFVSGAGIYTRRGISVLHLLSSVSLLDCKTGQILASQRLYQDRPDAKYRDRLVSVPLPTEVSRTPIPQWTPEIENRIRQELVELPKAAWGATLRSMLIQK